MRQFWRELLFMHWQLPAEALHPFVPSGLALHTYEGQAWIAVVPFRMTHIHPRGLFPLPWLSAFPELNVRIYVTDGEKPGVLFLSLDAANPIGVWLGRNWYHLPYIGARMTCQSQGDTIHYHSTRQDAAFVGRYQATGAGYHAQPGSLEHWLTERYCLYTQTRGGKLLRSEIHHLQWSLQPATAHIETNTMLAVHGIAPPPQAPLLHYAQALEVLVWALEAV